MGSIPVAGAKAVISTAFSFRRAVIALIEAMTALLLSYLVSICLVILVSIIIFSPTTVPIESLSDFIPPLKTVCVAITVSGRFLYDW